MGGRFHTIATFFSYAYLLRVPLIIGLVLVVLPPAAIWGPGRQLLENLFVLTPGNILWVTIVALMLAWSLLVVWRLILLNGQERFGLDQWMTRDRIVGWHILVAALPAASIIVCGFVEKMRVLDRVPPWQWIIGAAAGVMIAYTVGFLGLVLSVTLAPRYHPDDPAYAARYRFKAPLLPGSEQLLDAADRFRLIRPRDPDRWANWALEHLPQDLRSGYTDRHGHLFPGHWLALTLFATSLLVYGLFGALRAYRLGMPTSVPAVTYVLILMLVLNWLLSATTFFLDRYRVPLLFPLGLFCVLAGLVPQSDHYFAIRDGVLISPVSPVDVLANHGKRHTLARYPNGVVVVVATAGGGIQAAGWTARVLTGLQEQCPNFADSIAAISAVSGGAAGSLFFLNQYKISGVVPGFHPSAAELRGVIDQAETPALSDIAWAIAYVDPLRLVLPYVNRSDQQKIMDRGYVLEQTWRNKASINAYLSNWREGVVDGWRPAVIFNATIAETGQPFLLSTSDFDTGSDIPARQTFAQAFPNSDLAVVTAARLAASFPYVAPASRPLSSKPEYHIVDGGYYDNFGVDSLIAWLEQGLTALSSRTRAASHAPTTQKIPDVIFIQIRSFPIDAFPAPGTTGWFYQTYAPLDGLMAVRTTAQLVRDREELMRLQQKWLAAGHVNIEAATFEFSGADAPLSWQLNDSQRARIDDAWQNTLTRAEGRRNVDVVRGLCGPAAGQPTSRPSSRPQP